jgi:hypothetical protein
MIPIKYGLALMLKCYTNNHFKNKKMTRMEDAFNFERIPYIFVFAGIIECGLYLALLVLFVKIFI